MAAIWEREIPNDRSREATNFSETATFGQKAVETLAEESKSTGNFSLVMETRHGISGPLIGNLSSSRQSSHPEYSQVSSHYRRCLFGRTESAPAGMTKIMCRFLNARLIEIRVLCMVIWFRTSFILCFSQGDCWEFGEVRFVWFWHRIRGYGGLCWVYICMSVCLSVFSTDTSKLFSGSHVHLLVRNGAKIHEQRHYTLG